MIRTRRHLAGFAAVMAFFITCSAFSENGDAAPPVEPDDVTGLLVEAGELMAAGRMKEAELVIREVLEKSPGHDAARSLLATVLGELGRPAEAGDIFEELISRNFQNHIMLNNYAWMLATTSDPDVRDTEKAIRLAQEAILLNPNNYSIWSTLAEAHYAGGNFERAARIMNECLQIVIDQQQPADVIQRYREQLLKIREAAAVMRLIE